METNVEKRLQANALTNTVTDWSSIQGIRTSDWNIILLCRIHMYMHMHIAKQLHIYR